ncbi:MULTISPECIES: NGO_0222 family membrane protein [Eikenella]|uniref:Uncharacterized protein n=1 Tax=Eikenella longinqua TaxID=1795827 RepID=A0A1A9S0X0_9NEIS|nr:MULTISPECIES: NGO_0222 family membrane protein [Eikenella]OAM31051.1 hypothetical protein A7P95_00665 [Eikenella longinqua]
MNKTRRYLKLTALFTILFILLLLLGNCLIILRYIPAAIASFVAAFVCVAGQMMALGKFLRQKQLAALQAQAALAGNETAATENVAETKDTP